MTSVRRPARVLLLLFAVLLVQGLLIVDYADDPFSDTPVSDALSYRELAATITRDGTAALGVFHQAPLYPWLLARTSGAVDPLWLQAVLFAGAVALLLPLGRELFGSEASGWIAAALAVACPVFAFHALKLLPVTLAIFTQVAALWLLVRALRLGSGFAALLAGAGWGVAALARAEMLLVVPLAALLVGRERSRTARARWTSAGLLLLGASAAVLPATAHNLRQGDFVLIASSGGENLFIGNQRDASGGHKTLHPEAGDIFSQRLLARRVAEADLGRPLAPSEISAYWRGRALDEIAADPLRWLALEGRKLGRMLSPADPTDLYSYSLERSTYLPSLWLRFVPTVLLAALAIVGTLAVARSRLGSTLPLYGLCLVHGTVLMLFFVSTRLRTPLYFLLALPAAHGALVLWRVAVGPRRRAALVASLAVLLVWGHVAGSGVPDHEILRLASVLSRTDRVDEALATLRPTVERPDPYPLGLDHTGWLHQKRGELAEAVTWYRRALDSELPAGRRPETWSRLATVHERSGALAEAARAHDAAVAEPEAGAGAFFERGLFRQRRGDADAARADLERAAALAPDWPAPRAALERLGAQPIR